jgi:cbb3-type cytochrome oxidase maturation protein
VGSKEMSALIITIPISVILVIVFIKFFLWAVENGQFTDAEKYKNIVFNHNEGHENDDRIDE